MTIKAGDTIPSLTLVEATGDGPRDVTTDSLFAGRTVVLFGVPGAFTPTCSARHLPGFVEHAAALAAKGVDTLACLAVNDPFVLNAWSGAQDPAGTVRMIADGSGTLTRALGLELDLSHRAMGVRCQRFVLIARDGRVEHLAVEEPGAFEVSRAESVLALL